MWCSNIYPGKYSFQTVLPDLPDLDASSGFVPQGLCEVIQSGSFQSAHNQSSMLSRDLQILNIPVPDIPELPDSPATPEIPGPSKVTDTPVIPVPDYFRKPTGFRNLVYPFRIL